MTHTATTRRERRAERRATARRLAALRRTNRAASRVRRHGQASLTTHLLSAGLTPREARSAAGTLRRIAAELDITGTPGRCRRNRRMRDVTRYTPEQISAAATVYARRARKTAYKAAAYRLAA